MLTLVLQTKLPPEVRLIVTREASGEDLNLETLQTALEKELVARSAPTIQPGTTVILKIRLGRRLLPLRFFQGHKSPAEGPWPVATANGRTPQLVAQS